MASYLYDPKTGEPVLVDDSEKARALVAQGKLGFARGQVTIQRKNGEMGVMDSKEALKALTAGEIDLPSVEAEAQYRPAAEMHRFLEENPLQASGLALLQGAGSGISLGLAPAVRGWLSPDETTRQMQGAVKEESPVSNFAGEMIPALAGVGAPAAAMGIGRAVTADLAGQGAGLAARVGAKAAGEAVTGGIFGLGAFLNESGMEANPDLSAEKLLASVGGGAGLGGALGAGGELLSTGVKAAGRGIASALGGGKVREKLLEFADEQTARALGVTPKMMRDAGSVEQAREHMRRLREMDVVLPGRTAGDHRDVLAALYKNEKGPIVGSILDEADAKAPGMFDVQKFENDAVAMLNEHFSDPALAGPRGAAERWLKEFHAGSTGVMTLREAAAMKSKLGDIIFTEGSNPLTGIAAKRGLKAIRGLLDDTVERGVNEAMGPEVLAAYQDAKANVAALKFAAPGLKRAEFNEFLGKAPGGVEQFADLTSIPGLKFLQKNFVRPRGHSVAAYVSEKLLNSDSLETAAKNLQGYLRKGLDMAPDFGGAFRQTIAEAAARGSSDALATHVHLAANEPGYLDAVQLHDESPAVAQAALEKSDRLSKAREVQAAQDARLDELSSALLKGGMKAPPSKVPTAADLRQHKAALDAMRGDTLKQLQLDPRLTDVAPELVPLLAAKRYQAMQYLNAMMPKPPEAPFRALARKWEPSRADLVRWGNTLEGVQDPHTALARIAAGTATKAHIDALQTVYPKLYIDFMQRTIIGLAGKTDAASYAQRRALAKLTGGPMGGAGDQMTLQLIQAAHAKGHQPAGGSTKQDGRQVVDSAKNMQTQAQRIEGRGGGKLQ